MFLYFADQPRNRCLKVHQLHPSTTFQSKNYLQLYGGEKIPRKDAKTGMSKILLFARTSTINIVVVVVMRKIDIFFLDAFWYEELVFSWNLGTNIYH